MRHSPPPTPADHRPTDMHTVSTCFCPQPPALSPEGVDPPPAPSRVLFSRGVSHLVIPQTRDQVTCLGQPLEAEGTHQESGGQGGSQRHRSPGQGAGRAAPRPAMDRGWRATAWRGGVPGKQGGRAFPRGPSGLRPRGRAPSVDVESVARSPPCGVREAGGRAPPGPALPRPAPPTPALKQEQVHLHSG